MGMQSNPVTNFFLNKRFVRCYKQAIYKNSITNFFKEFTNKKPLAGLFFEKKNFVQTLFLSY